MYHACVKRALDLLVALAAAVTLLPLWAVVSACVLAESPGPVFFKQQRVGKNKTCFQILKFRTMRADTPRDVPTHLLDNPERYITRGGAFLRRTSLDELPQLINIIKGEMSLVGPRPALWNQYDLVAERDKYGANALVPGLTGLAQMRGRDELPIALKAAFDGEYARKISFGFDLFIIFATAVKVLTGEGIKEGSNGKKDYTNG
ncbi:MAG: sugar transferase [Clostridiales bacterium]|jgi:O-antigen biosynthesis protein WbqP|nr:sugar transferase [Clostridiales bacterium]